MEPLIRVLGDKDRQVRWSAALALGETEDRRAVKPLKGALRDEDERVRETAASSLGKIKRKRKKK